MSTPGIISHRLSTERVTMATRGIVVVTVLRDTGLTHPVVTMGTANTAALGVTELTVGDTGAPTTIGLHSALAWLVGDKTKLNSQLPNSTEHQMNLLHHKNDME